MDDSARQLEKVNLAEKLSLVTDHWRPKIVGELNYVEDARFTAPQGVRI